MAYSADSFTALEVPTLTKMNKLWSNDASFNDGTGIANNAIKNSHILAGELYATKFYNPYKFAVRRVAAHVSSNAYTKIQFDTEEFDTSSNHATSGNIGRFTAPANGFYFFHSMAGNTVAGATPIFVSLYKNGTKVRTGSGAGTAANGTYSNVSGLLQLSSGDYVEAWFVGGGGSTMGVDADCHFQGWLVSAT